MPGIDSQLTQGNRESPVERLRSRWMLGSVKPHSIRPNTQSGQSEQHFGWVVLVFAIEVSEVSLSVAIGRDGRKHFRHGCNCELRFKAGFADPT